MAYPAWENLAELDLWEDRSTFDAWEQPTDPATLPNWEGDTGETVSHNGITYGIIGKHGLKWLDRNLGATSVPLSKDDTDGYGDLYQWGRLSDNHENRSSSTTSTLSTTDEPGHGDFIVNTSGNDWRNPSNDTLWQGEAGINNPSPTGFRLPTSEELNTERLSWTSQDEAGAFGSNLKWPTSKSRSKGTGNVVSTNRYWSLTTGTSSTAAVLEINDGFDFSRIAFPARASGCAVRPVSTWKINDEVQHNATAYRCLIDNTTEEPGTGADWEVIAYQQNDKVTHIDAAWESDVNNNADEPPTNWTNITYQTGDRVQHVDQFWQSPTDDNLDEPPTNWTDIGYKIGDRVLHNGGLWEAQVNDTTEEPGTGGDWLQVFAEVTTNAVTGILIDGATLNATITETGQGDILKRGFQVSTTSGEPYEIVVEESGSFTDEAYSLSVSDLGRETYFVRAFVENIDGIAYGDEVTFTTGQAPVILNQFVTNRESQTATLNAEIDDGNRTPTQQGFVYGTTSLPTPEVDPAVSDYTNVVFTIPADITGLNPNQTYYYRAFAENEFGLVYGDEQSFTTVSFPNVTGIENIIANPTPLTNTHANSTPITTKATNNTLLTNKQANNNGIINKTANPTNLNNVTP